MEFKPDGILIINGYKIQIVTKFACYCTPKLRNIYLKEKKKKNFDSKGGLKLSIDINNQSLKYLITKENLSYLQSFFCMKTLIITKYNIEFLKLISNELDIFLLTNALEIYEESIKDNFSSTAESVKLLKDDEDIQNLLEKYLLKNDQSNEIKNRIINLQFENHYFFQLMTNLCISYPKNVDKILKLIKEMDKLQDFTNFLNFNSSQIFQNEKKNILSEIENIKEQKQNEINMIFQSIRNDDIDEFQRISSLTPSFNFDSNIHEIISNESIYVNKITLFTNINELFNVNIVNNRINYLDYSAFFGSIKIFKFLLMKKAEMSHFIALFAVAGGNIEIIHLCEQNKCCFKDALKIAIMYRRVDLVDWLVDTINVDDFETFIDDIIFFHRNDLILKYINLQSHEKVIQKLISKSIIFDNYQLFVFLNDIEKIDLRFKFGKNKCNIFSLLSNYNNDEFFEFLFNKINSKSFLEEKDIYGLSAAHFAAKSGNLKLMKYLVQKKVNIMSFAYDDLTPLHFACMFGQYEIVEYLLSIPNINVNCLDRNKQTPLSKICVTNYTDTLKIIELLLKNIFVKCNYIDIHNKTIILNTIQNGTDEASIMLIKSIKKDIDVNKSDNYYNPLCLACKLKKMEVVRCLLDRNDIDINEQAKCGVLKYKFFFLLFSPSHCCFKFNPNC